jgi:hypothetical protein
VVDSFRGADSPSSNLRNGSTDLDPLTAANMSAGGPSVAVADSKAPSARRTRYPPVLIDLCSDIGLVIREVALNFSGDTRTVAGRADIENVACPQSLMDAQALLA